MRGARRERLFVDELKQCEGEAASKKIRMDHHPMNVERPIYDFVADRPGEVVRHVVTPECLAAALERIEGVF